MTLDPTSQHLTLYTFPLHPVTQPWGRGRHALASAPMASASWRAGAPGCAPRGHGTDAKDLCHPLHTAKRPHRRPHEHKTRRCHIRPASDSRLSSSPAADSAVGRPSNHHRVPMGTLVQHLASSLCLSLHLPHAQPHNPQAIPDPTGSFALQPTTCKPHGSTHTTALHGSEGVLCAPPI
jgi:hypothetical protein